MSSTQWRRFLRHKCIGGPKVLELERKIAAVRDCRYAVGVSSRRCARRTIAITISRSRNSSAPTPVGAFS